MYCIKCGVQLSEESNFCSKCGHSLKTNPLTINLIPPENKDALTNDEHSTDKISNTDQTKKDVTNIYEDGNNSLDKPEYVSDELSDKSTVKTDVSVIIKKKNGFTTFWLLAILLLNAFGAVNALLLQEGTLFEGGRIIGGVYFLAIVVTTITIMTWSKKGFYFMGFFIFAGAFVDPLSLSEWFLEAPGLESLNPVIAHI